VGSLKKFRDLHFFIFLLAEDFLTSDS